MEITGHGKPFLPSDVAKVHAIRDYLQQRAQLCHEEVWRSGEPLSANRRDAPRIYTLNPDDFLPDFAAMDYQRQALVLKYNNYSSRMNMIMLRIAALAAVKKRVSAKELAATFSIDKKSIYTAVEHLALGVDVSGSPSASMRAETQRFQACIVNRTEPLSLMLAKEVDAYFPSKSKPLSTFTDIVAMPALDWAVRHPSDYPELNWHFRNLGGVLLTKTEVTYPDPVILADPVIPDTDTIDNS